MECSPKTVLDRWMRDNHRDDASVAAEVGKTRSQINRIRNGASNPSWDTARALATLTGISIAELFERLDCEAERHEQPHGEAA